MVMMQIVLLLIRNTDSEINNFQLDFDAFYSRDPLHLQQLVRLKNQRVDHRVLNGEGVILFQVQWQGRAVKEKF